MSKKRILWGIIAVIAIIAGLSYAGVIQGVADFDYLDEDKPAATAPAAVKK
jgi:hypothetical protein